MRIHHLNCGTLCPIACLGHDRDLVCHCLLIETDAGLVLVDTGFGQEDVLRPTPRLSRLMLAFNRIPFDLRDTAIEQVREKGFKPADVRHIVLTHLDFDHAGGISDFPQATVHLSHREAVAARHRHGLIRRRRYRPAQWRAASKWQEYKPGGEAWFGFEAVRQLEGLPPEILLVPLAGHSPGHCGVAVRAPSGWLLHAGDAYFARGEIDPAAPRPPRCLRFYETMMETDHASRLANQARLRDLHQQRPAEVAVFCSHDPEELHQHQRAAEAAR